MTRHLQSTLLAGCLLGTLTASAQVSSVELETTIQSAGTDYAESVGYTMTKYNTTTTARKSYYRFDIPSNANTNYGLDLTFTSARKQFLQVWALNQAYPGLNTNILWANAQANQTNQALNNDLLTDPTNTFTATPLYQMVSPGGSSFGTFGPIHIPAPWGQYVFGNKLILVITGREGDGTGDSGGFRVNLNTTTLGYDVVYTGTAPSLGAINNLTVFSTQASATNSFTVGDTEDGPSGLTPVAVSSDEAVLPSANVSFGGSGASRTVSVVGGAAGTAEIIVTVVDADGNRAERAFQVTVEPFDLAPTVSDIAPTNTLLNTAVIVPFTISDVETDATNLVVSGTIADYSTNILASLAFGGTDSNRTVTITPVAGSNGVGVVTVDVMDGYSNTTSVSFGVMVLPSGDTVFIDHFDYPAGKLFDQAPGFWVRRGASPGNVNLNTSPDLNGNGVAYIRPKGNADDGVARLAGAPYTVGSGAVLYSFFSATWLELGAEVVTNSNGPFFMLAINPTATSGFNSDVRTTVDGVTPGSFQLGFQNYESVLLANTNVDIPIPFTFSGPYNVAVRYDVDTGIQNLWVNATSEADPSVSGIARTNVADMSYAVLRQDVDMGYIYVDDLKVVLVQKPILASITPPSGGSLDIFFTGGVADTGADYDVVGSPTVDGTYNPVPNSMTALGGGSFKATVTGVSGDANFYKVIRTAIMSF